MGALANNLAHPFNAKTVLDPVGLFSKAPSPGAVPPPIPTAANSQNDLDIAAQQQGLALQRGRSATYLTGGAGLSDLGTTSKVLLGR